MSGSFSENGVASLGVSFEVSGLRMGASIWLIDESLKGGAKRCTEALAGGLVVSCRRSLQAVHVSRCRLPGGSKRGTPRHARAVPAHKRSLSVRRKAKGSYT